MSENTENRQDEEAPAEDPWDEALQEQSAAAADVTSAPPGDTVKPAQQQASPQQPEAAALETFSNNGIMPNNSDVNLDVILDVPLNISMEIGHTKITIRNLLQLNQGSVVELDRMAGEHLDVMVNGTLVAHGEVVVVNEKFGIRLTDVVSPVERIKNLRP